MKACGWTCELPGFELSGHQRTSAGDRGVHKPLQTAALPFKLSLWTSTAPPRPLGRRESNMPAIASRCGGGCETPEPISSSYNLSECLGEMQLKGNCVGAVARVRRIFAQHLHRSSSSYPQLIHR